MLSSIKFDYKANALLILATIVYQWHCLLIDHFNVSVNLKLLKKLFSFGLWVKIYHQWQCPNFGSLVLSLYLTFLSVSPICFIVDFFCIHLVSFSLFNPLIISLHFLFLFSLFTFPFNLLSVHFFCLSQLPMPANNIDHINASGNFLETKTTFRLLYMSEGNWKILNDFLTV